MKITALDPLVGRDGSEIIIVVSTISGEPVTYRLSLADLVDSAALLAFSSTDPTLAANSDALLPTQKATKAFVASSIAAAIANLVGAAPAQLDQINELAGALANDANFAATMTAALAGKVSQAQVDAAIAAAIAALPPASYSFGSFAPAAITASEVLIDHIFARAVTLPANLAGTRVSAGTPPAANWIGTLYKTPAAGGAAVAVATVTISAAGAVTLATTGGAAIAFAAGDLATFTGPAAADGTLARLRYTFLGA